MDQLMELMQRRYSIVPEKAKQEIRVCNELSCRYGPELTEQDIEELVQGRIEALHNSGRVEFGGGILPKLIDAFCDSPYIEQDNYAVILGELQDAFYNFMSDSGDAFTDDELIEIMVKVFNGRAGGSVEYLCSSSLDAMSRYARAGYDAHNAEEEGDLF